MNRFVSLCLCVFVLTAMLHGAVRPPLSEAVKGGDKDTARTLIQKGTNVNETEPDGTTALHWAAYRDDFDTAELLLKAGAKVNAANDLGVTPLWTACQNGSDAMVRRLLAAGANPNAKLTAGETPLLVAARVGNASIAEQLIAKGADVNARASRDQTPLMWAVAQKHPEVVKVLLAHKADVNARSATWTDVEAVAPHGYLDYNKAIPHGNDTALLFAARAGDLDSAKLLVAAGANVNDEDAWGVSATTMAAHAGVDELVEFFLDKGANPNAMKAGFAAIHDAVMRRDERMVNALLAHGANPNLPLQTWTPTRRSSKDWNFEPDLIGATPFFLAARWTAPNVMRALLKAGADPMFVQHSDRVPDRFPFSHRKDTITTLMAAVGMGGGGTPWVEIAKREAVMLETVKMLVELGADVNAANAEGRRPLDAAKTLKYESVVNYLTEKGAKPGTAPATPQRGR